MKRFIKWGSINMCFQSQTPRDNTPRWQHPIKTESNTRKVAICLRHCFLKLGTDVWQKQYNNKIPLVVLTHVPNCEVSYNACPSGESVPPLAWHAQGHSIKVKLQANLPDLPISSASNESPLLQTNSFNELKKRRWYAFSRKGPILFSKNFFLRIKSATENFCHT